MTQIADLLITEWWHEPQLSYDEGLPGEFAAILIGWLGDAVPSVGEVDAAFLEKLAWASDNQLIDQGALGFHECEICHDYYDRAEILVKDDKAMYVAPRMIVHYIRDHAYRPPDVFIQAVNKIALPQQ